MAEVPEVEMLARGLREAVVGRRWTGARVLAPEAVRSPAPDAFGPRLARRRSPLKTVLLDQRVVAGLGNRDADESLWEAGIDPRRAAASLSGEEMVRLAGTMRKVLDEGLALGGTQRDLFGNKGRALHRRNVFECTGKPCPRCGAKVEHLRLGGRNTHFCAQCQPAEGRKSVAPGVQGEWLF